MHQDQRRGSTPPVLFLASGKTEKGLFEVYVSDPNNVHPCRVYDYSSIRKQAVAQKYSKDYQGYLKADAFSGHNRLSERGKVIDIGCMAHVRRKFFEIVEIAGCNTLEH